MDRGHRHGVYGDIGDVVTHRSQGAESHYVLRHTFYIFTLGKSPASIDPAHFRRAGNLLSSYKIWLRNSFVRSC
jgi:hypothetical protein